MLKSVDEWNFFGIYLHIICMSGPSACQVACGMTVKFSVAVLTTQHPVSLSWPCGFNNEKCTSVIYIETA